MRPARLATLCALAAAALLGACAAAGDGPAPTPCRFDPYRDRISCVSSS